jgi:hypothetical protein
MRLRLHILTSSRPDRPRLRSDDFRTGAGYQQRRSTNDYGRGRRLCHRKCERKNDLVVTINFGEVSPLNTNSIVKVVVPIALRSNQPYQVAVSMSGLTTQMLRRCKRRMLASVFRICVSWAAPGKICNQSTHIIRSPFQQRSRLYRNRRH